MSQAHPDCKFATLPPLLTSRRIPQSFSFTEVDKLAVSLHVVLIIVSIGSTDSNDAVHISLVTPGVAGNKTLHNFNPKFTYPIFGDAERIFGYQGLKINLRYNACDMRPGLQITYAKRFKAEGETAPTDLRAILEEYLPNSEVPLYCLYYYNY